MTGKSSTFVSTAEKRSSPVSSLLASAKLSLGFSTKVFSDLEAMMSPISILERKFFYAISFPFFTERNHRKPYCGNEDSRAIGLALVDALTKESSDKRIVIQSSRILPFGLQHKIRIPAVKSSSSSFADSVESPRTPIEFGIKNKNSQLALHSPGGLHSDIRPSSPKIFTGCLSPREMELSEDYTCVISYGGPTPKKTHIFDNCIMESSGDGFLAWKKESRFSADQRRSGCHSEHFLNFCHGCKKRLAQGKDIFMYRGERAFCRHECRQIKIMSDDEGTEICFHDLLDPL